MFVAAANHYYILALKTQVSRIDVCWHIYTCQMSDMHRTVGIWEGCGDEGTFESGIFHTFGIVFFVG